VCVGDDVNITCGYTSSAQFVPIWIIGGETHTRREITQSSAYHIPVVDKSEDTLLTVYSVSELDNQTTFQCEFPLPDADVLSSIGTLVVMGELCYLHSAS